MKQQYFPDTKPQVEFGGSLLTGRRKSMRPLNTKKSHHLVLKANNLIERFPGVSFTGCRSAVTKIIKTHAENHNVKVDSLSVNFNHCHLAIRFRSRKDYVRFIRAVTAHLVKFLSKFFSQCLTGLFDLRPFSKIVEWGRQYKNLLNYIQTNIFESEGATGLRKSPKNRTKL